MCKGLVLYKNFYACSDFMKQAGYTVQLRYIWTTHTRIIRSYFAYTCMSIRVYAYVNMRVYVPLLGIPISFFIWSIVGQTKDRLQSEICILLKRHADQWKLSHFKFSITQFFDSCLILSFQIWEENWNSRLKSLS